MASGRMISVAFFQSETIASLPRTTRYFFVGLFTNADDQGRMKAHPALLRSRIYPYDDVPLDEIDSDIAALEAGDFIIRYETEGRCFVQIKNWWRYQHPRWAWPSEYPPPEGWEDRYHYRQGNRIIDHNWAATPEANDDEPDGASDTGPTVEPPRGHDGNSVEPAPNGNDNGNDNGNAEKPGAPPPEKPKPRRRKQPEEPPKEPTPLAVARYRTIARMYPDKAIWPEINSVIGEDETNLAFWEKVMKAWIACGWSKRNVKGMMEWYVRRELPTTSKKGANNGANRASGGAPGSARVQSLPASPDDPADIERKRAAMRAHNAARG